VSYPRSGIASLFGVAAPKCVIFNAPNVSINGAFTMNTKLGPRGVIGVDNLSIHSLNHALTMRKTLMQLKELKTSQAQLKALTKRKDTSANRERRES
jgi:hypothetical protein